MGGRIHGFLGGVLFTSAWVYYTGEYIKKDQEFVSKQLRISDTIIQDGIISGNKVKYPVVPKETKVDVNAGFNESAKDIWNEEIIKGVNWVYAIDWHQMGLDLVESVLLLGKKSE